MRSSGPYATFRGRVAERAARSLLEKGQSGVVADVRFAPNGFAAIERKGWTSVSVRVGTVNRRFDNSPRGRVPLVVEMPPGSVSIRVDANAETPSGVPARLDADSRVRRGHVTVVAVYTPTRGLFLRANPARLDVRMAYLDADGNLAWETS